MPSTGFRYVADFSRSRGEGGRYYSPSPSKEADTPGRARDNRKNNIYIIFLPVDFDSIPVFTP